jgi:hypothetical protein
VVLGALAALAGWITFSIRRERGSAIDLPKDSHPAPAKTSRRRS